MQRSSCQPRFAGRKKECLENIERIDRKNTLFINILNLRAEELNILNVRQCGTIVAFEVNDANNNYTSSIKELFTDKALKNGVYLRPLGNTVYIMPPYCITDEELEKVYASYYKYFRRNN